MLKKLLITTRFQCEAARNLIGIRLFHHVRSVSVRLQVYAGIDRHRKNECNDAQTLKGLVEWAPHEPCVVCFQVHAVTDRAYTQQILLF